MSRQLLFTSDFPHNFSYDEKLILNFFHNLYKINVKINGLQDHLFNELPETDKTYCASLKYWLYEEIGKIDPKGQEINKNFQKLKELLDSRIQGKLSVLCTFNELKWDEHQKLKSIYAFLLIYYSNIDAFNENKIIKCKYMDYIGKGLK
ncbi:PIR Superfamily Protein [Plasmodium ovale wallikeri]|uniref:PIR Superfamily Protein n=1 Tax=Plasmodium ovale wallikeri TaxID=864142 RepID=A0A1A9AGW9_PLAOA|nr:PIR Superfamily Protein [Plasmodium ovale wallikeri]